MFYLDDQLAQQRHRERLQQAEQERLVGAARAGQRRAAQGERPTFRLWQSARWLARRLAIPAQ